MKYQYHIIWDTSVIHWKSKEFSISSICKIKELKMNNCGFAEEGQFSLSCFCVLSWPYLYGHKKKDSKLTKCRLIWNEGSHDFVLNFGSGLISKPIFLSVIKVGHSHSLHIVKLKKKSRTMTKAEKDSFGKGGRKQMLIKSLSCSQYPSSPGDRIH